MKKRALSDSTVTTGLILATIVLLASAGALNGGTALVASGFDTIIATIKSMLASTMVLSFAFVALFAAVWQVTHGKGYGMLSIVLGVLAVAILGPAIVTTTATATRDPAALVQHAAAAQSSIVTTR